jgi:hypothetical protein
MTTKMILHFQGISWNQNCLLRLWRHAIQGRKAVLTNGQAATKAYARRARQHSGGAVAGGESDDLQYDM